MGSRRKKKKLKGRKRTIDKKLKDLRNRKRKKNEVHKRNVQAPA